MMTSPFLLKGLNDPLITVQYRSQGLEIALRKKENNEILRMLDTVLSTMKLTWTCRILIALVNREEGAALSIAQLLVLYNCLNKSSVGSVIIRT